MRVGEEEPALAAVEHLQGKACISVILPRIRILSKLASSLSFPRLFMTAIAVVLCLTMEVR
jgi:hypothetical protein